MTSRTRQTSLGTSLDDLLSRELGRFERQHPRSRELSARPEQSLLAGVPMPWMIRWAGGFPVFAADAHGARFRDADGHEYVDFCLGDTAAMTGHSPEPTVRAVTEQVRRGITLMLPSEDSLWVGRELAHGDVACVLAEPALTNIGIVLPEPGFHTALRAATRRHETLLIIDETHTICAGPGGYTAAHGLEPDVLTIGKAIAAGIPAAAYGFSADVADRLESLIPSDVRAELRGIGDEVAASVLPPAATTATLSVGLTEQAFER